MSKEDDFTRVFIIILALLLVFTFVVALIARSVGLDENSGPMADKDVQARTQPYGSVNVSAEATPAPAEEPKTMTEAAAESMTETPAPAETAPVAAAAAIDGKALYAACMGCHATGVAGAPKLGDKAGWAPRIAAGMDRMVETAIKGKGAMPPKGGRMDFSDEQIRAIVEYMAQESQ